MSLHVEARLVAGGVLFGGQDSVAAAMAEIESEDAPRWGARHRVRLARTARRIVRRVYARLDKAG